MLTREDMRGYQNRAVNFGIAKRSVAFFIDMGLGKTVIVLTIIQWLLARKAIDSVLIVAPIRVVYTVWEQEAKKWSHTKKIVFSIVHGTPTERLKALNTPAHIYLINPEGLQWLQQVIGHKDWPFDMLVVDESSMFKRSRTKRFRALRRGLRYFSRRIIMTGTPTPQGLVDLWSQMFIVDLGRSLGTRFTDYKSNNFHSVGYRGYKLEPNDGALKVITDSIGPRVVRLEAADWVKLPPVIDVPVWVDLPPEARTIYKQAEKQMFLDFNESLLEIRSAASLSNSCSQIASGALWTRDKVDETKKIWVPIHDAKLTALGEIVDELQGEPPLVVYRFQHDLERIKSMYPRFAIMGKGTTPKASVGVERNWNLGKYEGMIIHPQSGGHGLNLQDGGRHIIWYSVTWSLEMFQQLIKRLHRGAITKPVFNYMLLTRSTVDEVILEAIEHKGLGQRAVNSALKSYYEDNYGY